MIDGSCGGYGACIKELLNEPVRKAASIVTTAAVADALGATVMAEPVAVIAQIVAATQKMGTAAAIVQGEM